MHAYIHVFWMYFYASSKGSFKALYKLKGLLTRHIIIMTDTVQYLKLREIDSLFFTVIKLEYKSMAI